MDKEVLLSGGLKEAQDLFRSGKIMRFIERDDKYFAVFKETKKAVIAASKKTLKKLKKELNNG